MTALLDREALPAAPQDADGLWGLRDVRITAADGGVVFEQLGVEFPVEWSDTAARIAAQKYFRGSPGAPDREWSLRQVLDRVVGTVVRWAEKGGHLTAGCSSEFAAGLKGLLAAQKAAFNSPVYFNLGAPDRAQQVSACFILSVEDSLEGILEWIRQEGLIFRGGSGAGVNLSPLRGSMERLSGGGIASGPVSFMAGADASAGAIRSGGKTRRAAKMVLLDVDHPDIEEFIWCKALEERKSRSLAAAGFDMGINGGGYGLRYQNANNSVRVSDEFMAAVQSGGEYQLKERLGAAVRTVDARELFRQIAEAAWESADPGVQFSSTINRWHTCPESGRINASNPCSEYVHLDNSACNLASLNLVSFLDSGGSFDIEGFTAAVRMMITAMDALVDEADYPTELIGEVTRRHRQLGLGYSNLGAALMMLGLPYDSDAGRGWAAAVTALMTGAAYEQSAALAARLGPFAAWPLNAEAGLAVLRRHQAAVDDIHPAGPEDIRAAAAGCWERAASSAGVHGVRNSQVTVLAPTGTISFMMDCDTTGVEPDLALVKNKTLVGGGELRIVNSSVPRALTRLGYRPGDVAQVVENIERLGEASAEAGVRPEHVPVFATSLGRNRISPEGHVRMMAAVQPFLSGAISKTVNLDSDAAIEDVEELFMLSWKLGLKAVAVYRDGSKVAQPLSAGVGGRDSEAPLGRERRELPVSRRSRTVEWRVGDAKGYMTVGEYDDGLPGEVFVRVAKQGSTLAGLADGWAIAVSHGLQWGVPLSSYVSAFRGMRFEPGGITSDPDIRFATSVFDYLVRRLALDYLGPEERQALGVASASERAAPLPGLDTAGVEPHQPAGLDTAPICVVCGGQMIPAGSCYCCRVCGTTSGCS